MNDLHHQQMAPSSNSSPLHSIVSYVMHGYKIARVSAPFADMLLPVDDGLKSTEVLQVIMQVLSNHSTYGAWSLRILRGILCTDHDIWSCCKRQLCRRQAVRVGQGCFPYSRYQAGEVFGRKCCCSPDPAYKGRATGARRCCA